MPFCGTSCVPYNLTEFWHYLPGPHRLRAQSHRNPSLPLRCRSQVSGPGCHHLHFWPMAVSGRFPQPPSLGVGSFAKAACRLQEDSWLVVYGLCQEGMIKGADELPDGRDVLGKMRGRRAAFPGPVWAQHSPRTPTSSPAPKLSEPWTPYPPIGTIDHSLHFQPLTPLENGEWVENAMLLVMAWSFWWWAQIQELSISPLTVTSLGQRTLLSPRQSQGI